MEPPESVILAPAGNMASDEQILDRLRDLLKEVDLQVTTGADSGGCALASHRWLGMWLNLQALSGCREDAAQAAGGGVQDGADG